MLQYPPFLFIWWWNTIVWGDVIIVQKNKTKQQTNKQNGIVKSFFTHLCSNHLFHLYGENFCKHSLDIWWIQLSGITNVTSLPRSPTIQQLFIHASATVNWWSSNIGPVQYIRNDWWFVGVLQLLEFIKRPDETPYWNFLHRNPSLARSSFISTKRIHRSSIHFKNLSLRETRDCLRLGLQKLWDARNS